VIVVPRGRATFSKLQRDREKKAKAQAKLQRRAERADTTDDDTPPAQTATEEEILTRLAEVHKRLEAGEISIERFELDREELRRQLRID
jgi:hypothetical protein